MRTFSLSKSNAVLAAAASALLVFGVIELNAFSSGRTDRLKGAPIYKTYDKKAVAQPARAGYAALSLDETTKSDFSFVGREQALQPLLEAMNVYLDSLGWGKRLRGEALPEKGAPYVYVGSAEGEGAPPEAAMQRSEHDKYPPMVIHILKPSNAWRNALGNAARTDQTEFVLWLKLGFSEYPKANKGAFEKKVVLGAGYEEGIKFLSAEDKPVEVLQVTGILLDRAGNLVRAGAEGIVAKDSPFWVQVLEAQEGMSNEALRTLLHEERREDLPGRPLKWQVALRNLVAQLLAQPTWATK